MGIAIARLDCVRGLGYAKLASQPTVGLPHDIDWWPVASVVMQHAERFVGIGKLIDRTHGLQVLPALEAIGLASQHEEGLRCVKCE